MDMGIKGRRALVFGGSRGMGRAAAQCLSNEGVHVTIAARNPETLALAARDRKSTRLNSSHLRLSRMPSSA